MRVEEDVAGALPTPRARSLPVQTSTAEQAAESAAHAAHAAHRTPPGSPQAHQHAQQQQQQPAAGMRHVRQKVDTDMPPPAGISATPRATRPLNPGSGSPPASRSVSPARVRAVRAAIGRVLSPSGSGSDSPLSPSSAGVTPGSSVTPVGSPPSNTRAHSSFEAFGTPPGISQSVASQYSAQARKALEEGPYRAASQRTSGESARESADMFGGGSYSVDAQPGSPRETLPLKRPAPDAPSPANSDSSVGPSIGDHISAARSGIESGAGAQQAGSSRHQRLLRAAETADDDDVTSRQKGAPPLHSTSASSTAVADGGDTSADNALELARLRLTQDLSELPYAAANGGRSIQHKSAGLLGQGTGEEFFDAAAPARRSVRSLSDPLGGRLGQREAAAAAAAAAREGSGMSVSPPDAPSADVGSSLTRMLRLHDAAPGASELPGPSTFLRRGLGLKLQPSPQPPAPVSSGKGEGSLATSLKPAASAPIPSAPPQQTAANGSDGGSSMQTDGPAAAHGVLAASFSSNVGDGRQSLAATAQAQSPADQQAAKQQKALARLLLSRDRKGEALDIVEGLLRRDPQSTDLLCMRGNCLAASGNNVGAFASFASALAADSSHLETLSSCGKLYKQCGLLVESVESYRMAHSLDSRAGDVARNLAVVLTDLGTQLKLAGNADEGMAYYQEAVDICPTYAPAFYNVAVVHSEAGHASEAVQQYMKALQVAPNYAEAWCNLGVVHKNQGRLAEAVDAYERALAVAPNFEIVRNNLAIALTELGTKTKVDGDIEAGIRIYERALAHNPRYPDALYNLGVACGEAGLADRAIFAYEMAAHLNPNCAEALNNLGVLHRERGNLERASQCYTAALQIRPNFPQGLNNLAVVYTAQGLVAEALQLLQGALLAAPMYAEAHNNLGVLQRDVGAVPDALASYSKCLELSPGSRNAGQNRLLALNYIHQGETRLVCEAHEQWGIGFQASYSPMPALPPSQRESGDDAATAAHNHGLQNGLSSKGQHGLPNGTGSGLANGHGGGEGDDSSDDGAFKRQQLTVGYISPDLFTHSVSYFAEAPLRHHSPARIRHVVYNCVSKGDTKTDMLRNAVRGVGGVWRDVAHLSEHELAALVRADGVQILVELSGHTANNKLGVMALRPAPVQVTWIGYPNSTGLKALDYRFTDAMCDPADTKQTFVEELVRLPGCFLCYTPAMDAPPVAPSPATAAGFITFGSFNNLAKITPEVLHVWARILRAMPGSRLLLKNKPFACGSARAHTAAALSARGIDAGRVDLLPLAQQTSEHLATYAAMDVSLDTFPYAGTTTTCESLYMGVPCVTLAGGCHAHNVGVSLLAAVGLTADWVARSEDEYVDLAVAAASDIPKLAALRAGLRQQMMASQLGDAKPFVRRLEGVYHGLWRRYCKEAWAATDGATADGAAAGSAAAADMASAAAPAGATTAGDSVNGHSSGSSHRNASGLAAAEDAATADSVMAAPPPAGKRGGSGGMVSSCSATQSGNGVVSHPVPQADV